jgi:hypothetical protein
MLIITSFKPGFYVRIAFGIFILVMASIPALAILDAPLLQESIAVLALAALTGATFVARAADVIQTAEIMRPLKYLLILPVIWMVFQAIPMPFAPLAHSVWASAAAALQQELLGHVSIDPGRTIGALVGYLSGVALILLTVLVTRDRRRAEQSLLALGFVATLTALLLLIGFLGHFSALAGISSPDTLAAISLLGIILDLACGVRVYERYESRRGELDGPGLPVLNLIVCALGSALCLLAFICVATANLGIVAGFGVLTFALVQAIRRFDLPPWLVGALCLTVIAAGTMISIWRNDGNQALSFTLQFSGASGDAAVTTQRMVSDTSWLGNGAGTFTALLPIYQEAGAAIQNAPTTAAMLTVELGRAALLVIVAIAIWLIVILFRGALARGRDSFYPAAAASCAVLLLGLAFCNVGLSQSAVMLLAEGVIGLGLAQSISRVGTG